MTAFALVALFATLVVVAGCGREKQTTAEAAFDETTTPDRPAILATPVVDTPEVTIVEPPAPEAPPAVTYAEAEAAYNAKNYAQAVDLFSHYTDQHETNPWGYYMLGLSAWKSGDHGRAETAFQRALMLDPGNVKSWLNLSRVRLDDGRPDDALTSLDAAEVVDSTSSVVFRLKGRAYDQKGETAAAESAYRQALSLDAQDAWSMNNLALLYIDAGQFEEALPMLALAVIIRDDVAVFQNNLGMALENTRHRAEARDAYEKATALDAGYDRASANLARVEGVEWASDVEVDLSALAEAFREEIEGHATTKVAEQPEVDTGTKVADEPVGMSSKRKSDDKNTERTIAVSDTTQIGIE